MNKKNIFIDTDCGVDDATAIMLALAADNINVTGISAVAGNTSLDNVVNNVRGLLTVLGRGDIPLFRGASTGLVEQAVRAEDVHGGNGLGGIELPRQGCREDPRTAPLGLYETAREFPGLTLVTLGPLTNAAMALNLFPGLKELLGEIVIMGGALERGNITPHAEFNFAADPEAVQYVLDSGVPLAVVPWDLALDNMIPEETILALDMEDGGAGSLFLKLQNHSMGFMEKLHGERVASNPDPLTMAWVVDPSLAVETRTGGLRMELDRTAARGKSVFFDGGSVNIIRNIDRRAFLNLLLSIKKLKYL